MYVNYYFLYITLIGKTLDHNNIFYINQISKLLLTLLLTNIIQ